MVIDISSQRVAFPDRLIGELLPSKNLCATLSQLRSGEALGEVSLDGTKIKATASKHHAMSWAYAEWLEQGFREQWSLPQTAFHLVRWQAVAGRLLHEPG